MRKSQRQKDGIVNEGSALQITVDFSKSNSPNYCDRSRGRHHRSLGGSHLREAVALTVLLAVALKRGRCDGRRLNQAITPAAAKDPKRRQELYC